MHRRRQYLRPLSAACLAAGFLVAAAAAGADGPAFPIRPSENGRYLYVLAAGSHGIAGFEVGSDGSLTHADTEANVPVTAAGIAVR